MNDRMRKILNWASVHKLLLLIAVIILFAIIAEKREGYLWYRLFPRNFGVVEAGQIYRSGQIAPSLLKEVVLKNNIKVIVSLNGDSSQEERKITAELGIERVIFSLQGDGTGSVDDYARAVGAICQAQQENKPVLVHCASGAHRTGGVIAAYRLIVQKKDINFVRNEMIHYGFNTNNDMKLRTFLNKNMMKIADVLKQMGIINEVPSSLPEIRG
jgi:protein tyrosine/serine phosphatase